MKYSIVVPVFNCERTLRKCIESVVNQNYMNYQLILVDDGSKDDSYSVCQEYAAKYRTVITVQKENGGPSSARNKGIKMAEGEYLLFLDSDDWVSDNYFETLDKMLCQYDVDVLMFSNHGTITGDCVFPRKMLIGNREIVQFYCDNCDVLDFNSCCNKAYHRRVYESAVMKFTEGTVVEEDLLYNLNALSFCNSILLIPDILYFYNQQTSGSVTTKYNPKKFESIMNAYEVKIRYAAKWNSSKLVLFYKNQLLLFISSAIFNLMYKECPFSFFEKVRIIRAIYENEEVRECARCGGSKSLRARVMAVLINWKCAYTSWLIHWILSKGKKQ